MKIRKILNNNAVTAINSLGEEVVAMGTGIAFKKRIGDILEDKKVERIFKLENEEVADRVSKLVSEIPQSCLDVSEKIIKYAESSLDKKLDQSAFLAIADHINFAINRYKQGIIIKNPMRWEIKRFYKKEYAVGLEALKIVKDELGVSFEEDEAPHITLHIVNAQLNVDMNEVIEITNVMDGIINIIKYHFKLELKEETLYYYRLVNHLKYFAERVLSKNSEYKNDEFIYNLFKDKHKEVYECTKRISNFIEKNYDFKPSKEEIAYLMIHIQRILEDEKSNIG